MNAAPACLVVGIGNPTRGDDGAGWAVARQLELSPLPDVEIRCQQQLQIEDAADWACRRRIVVVDASVVGPPIRCQRVKLDESAPVMGTHHSEPRAIAALARALYGHTPEVLLCTVRGECFDFATTLSPPARKRVNRIVGRLRQLLGIRAFHSPHQHSETHGSEGRPLWS